MLITRTLLVLIKGEYIVHTNHKHTKSPGSPSAHTQDNGGVKMHVSFGDRGIPGVEIGEYVYLEIIAIPE